MEALRPEDPEAVAREVRELQQQWRAGRRCAARAGGRAVAAVQDRARRGLGECEAHFAAQAQERVGEPGEKDRALRAGRGAVRVDVWIQTAEAIKKLQAEWKTIGPVSRGQEKAIWDRFRAACDRFFTRRHEDLAQRKASWNENLAKKDALCAQAEALAESSDWDQATVEIKKLQAEWKTIGPVKKSKSDAIWQRFRAACDQFFARHAAASRHGARRAGRGARSDLRRARGIARPASEAPADLPATIRGAPGALAAGDRVTRRRSRSRARARSAIRRGVRRGPRPMAGGVCRFRSRSRCEPQADGSARAAHRSARELARRPGGGRRQPVADRAARGHAQGSARRQHDRRKGQTTTAASAPPPKKRGRRRPPGRGSAWCRTTSARHWRDVSSARCAASRIGRRRPPGAGRLDRAGGAGCGWTGGEARELVAALHALQQRIVEVAGRDRALLHERAGGTPSLRTCRRAPFAPPRAARRSDPSRGDT